MPRVAIVGAGVSGLSVGVCLGETLTTEDLDLTIFSETFSGSGEIGTLSSDAAGGVVRPTSGASHYGGTTNVDDTRRWTAITFDYLRHLHSKGVGRQDGLNELPLVTAYEGNRSSLPWFSTSLHSKMRVLSPTQAAEYYGLSPTFQTVWEHPIFLIESSRYLHYLTHRFKNQGGLMVQRKVSSLKELTREYDIVINCTGLGARKLIGDMTIYPVRGQIVEVQGPALKAVYMNEEVGRKDSTYIIPSYNRILLGGTADKDNWSTKINPEHTESIYRRCIEMCPRLQGAKITGGWAGLRPVRPTVRVEVDPEHSYESLLLHNYGHSGHGFALSWGCASDIAELVSTNLDLHPRFLESLSKL